MTSKKIVVTRWIAWTAAVIIMILTFISSSQTAEVSSKTSGGLISTVLDIVLPGFDDLPEAERESVVQSLQFLARKSAHFITYFMLGIAVFTAMYTYSIKRWLKYFISLFICLIYAVSDEIHQYFVPGRGPKYTDVLLDFAGSLTGVLFVTLIIAVFSATRKRRNGKMRKKELMKRLSDLVLTVEKLNKTVKQLKAENEELLLKVEELEKQKAVAVSESAEKAVVEEAVVQKNEPVSVDSESFSEPVGFTVRVVDEVDLSENTSSDEELNPMEYGAVIIGKITVESAKCCDVITKNGGNDVKELLSLVMGKSELAKAEILNIAMSEDDDTVKREKIDAELIEATDYFKSVSEQNK